MENIGKELINVEDFSKNIENLSQEKIEKEIKYLDFISHKQ